MNHLAVPLKLTQYCKSTILQKKKKKVLKLMLLMNPLEGSLSTCLFSQFFLSNLQ